MEDLKEAVRTAVSDIGGSSSAPDTIVHSVLGKGGFGVVYHGALPPHILLPIHFKILTILACSFQDAKDQRKVPCVYVERMGECLGFCRGVEGPRGGHQNCPLPERRKQWKHS